MPPPRQEHGGKRSTAVTFLQTSVSPGSVRRGFGSTVLPSLLTFLVIVASGGLLVMIEKGMLNDMVTQPTPRGVQRLVFSQKAGKASAGGLDQESQILLEIRNRTINSMCRQKNSPHGLSSLSPQQRKTLLKHVLVNDRYRFLYCYIPKAACSNWKRMLKVLNGALESSDTNSKMDHRHDLLSLSSMTDEEIDYRLKHYFKFTFVREPMERLLSAYRNKFGEVESYQRNYGVEIIKRYRNGGLADESERGDDVTFLEYVRYLLDEDVEQMNEHWMPMYNLCQPCAISYDFIGSHEHLERDAEFVLQQIGAPLSVRFPVRQSWYKPVTKETLHYYLCSLPQKLRRDLLSKYVLDFVLFAYPFPNVTTKNCRH
ncbi:carbohydrate sulfotransferase 14 [Gouania willdenowi]|uniref:Carbohydrate sulfotransferase n=1 Tax=Gouania willdenowi TaxID=441366 RepID=A0A8C5EL39_GOUWI|nr:carbohydrate sulfotransferase 14 [Gouania willdenowi]